MSDVTYVVRTTYTTDTTQASAGIDGLSRKMGGLGATLEGAKGLIDGVVGKVAALGAAMIGAGVAASAMAIKTGLVDVNANIEEARIGFATIFNMLGASDSFDQGLGVAKDLIEQIRKDAKDLPGEFGDFVSMAQTLAAPLLNAGKGIKEIRDYTRQTAIAGAAMGLPFEQAAREMAELLEGRAGTHNKLGMRMGITTHTLVKPGGAEFNKATADERMALLDKLLSKNDDALKAFGNSWKGLTSTLVDNTKQLFGRATLPLFERIKQELARVNKAFDENDGLGAAADLVGKYLVKGFDYGVAATEWLVRHWKAIAYEVREMGGKFKDALEKALPIAERIGSYLMNHGGDVAGGLLGARIGLGVATSPVVGELAGAAGTAGGVALGVAAVAAAGAIDVLTAKAGDMPPALDKMAMKGQEYWEEVKKSWGEVWDNIVGIGKDLLDVFRPLIDAIGFDLIYLLRELGRAMKWLSANLKAFTGWIRDQLAKVGLAPGDEDLGPDENAELGPAREAFMRKKRLEEVAKKYGPPTGPANAMTPDNVANALKKANALAGSGKANVTVNAPLTVLSDADPERLAKAVATHVDEKMRNALTSRSLTAMRAF